MGGIFSSPNILQQPYSAHELHLIVDEILFMNKMFIDKQFDWRTIKLDMILFRDGLKHVNISFNGQKSQEEIMFVVQSVNKELTAKHSAQIVCEDIQHLLNKIIKLELTFERQSDTNNTLDIGQYGIFGELTEVEQKLFDERAQKYLNPVLK